VKHNIILADENEEKEGNFKQFPVLSRYNKCRVSNITSHLKYIYKNHFSFSHILFNTSFMVNFIHFSGEEIGD